MKIFKFRYASVLKMREDREFDLKVQLATLISELSELEGRLIRIEESEQKYQSLFKDRTQRKANPDFATHERNIKYYIEQKRDAINLIELKKAEILNHQQILFEAMKERKAMEKLKEKEMQAYIDDMNMAENKAIEEIVNSRRKNGGTR